LYYKEELSVSLVSMGRKSIDVKLKCKNIDCKGVCGGTASKDRCGVCDGDDSSCKDDCGGVYGNNKDKDCNGDCFGRNLKKEFCFDANSDGDGDIKTKQIICPQEADKDWINNCSYLKGNFIISSKLNNLHSIRVRSYAGLLLNSVKVVIQKFDNISHPVNMNVGIYDLSAKSTYLFKEFEIRKNVQIFEDELTTVYIREDEVADMKKSHLNKVILSSSGAFILWLTWALIPYDM